MKKNRLKMALCCAMSFLMTLSQLVAQCNIKSTDQNAGYITYYLDPELVAQTADIGLALSVQRIAEKSYLAVSIQFSQKSEPIEEKIALTLKSGYTFELELYAMDVGTASGVEICAAVFSLEENQIATFSKSLLKSIQFTTQKGKSYDIRVTSNDDVLIRHLKCLLK